LCHKIDELKKRIYIRDFKEYRGVFELGSLDPGGAVIV
jgi:hypothetical protein